MSASPRRPSSSAGLWGWANISPHLIAMAFFVSGVATFIQRKTIGPVGSGLLSIQGTSFAFLGVIFAAGFAVKGRAGGGDHPVAGHSRRCQGDD
ncbi:solute carrier family 23 protein [Celeribacter sp.]|uniref:solute carrier family 23 protein n=1 Tax=Celeribacter sp. TaxID=1890673 RepID=UPI003A929F0A